MLWENGEEDGMVRKDVTFFEKKVTKKTFGPLRACVGPLPSHTGAKRTKSFFASFFSKKRSSLSETLAEKPEAIVLASRA